MVGDTGHNMLVSQGSRRFTSHTPPWNWPATSDTHRRVYSVGLLMGLCVRNCCGRKHGSPAHPRPPHLYIMDSCSRNTYAVSPLHHFKLHWSHWQTLLPAVTISAVLEYATLDQQVDGTDRPFKPCRPLSPHCAGQRCCWGNLVGAHQRRT